MVANLLDNKYHSSASDRKENWVEFACRQPVAFSQVREDALLDLDLITRAGGNQLRGLVVASGGCTVSALAAAGRFEHLQVVDINPSQLALTRLKLWLLENGDIKQRLQILGHAPMNSKMRSRCLEQILENLGIKSDILGDLEYVSELGPDHCGRYEIVFRALQEELNRLDEHGGDGNLTSHLLSGNYNQNTLAKLSIAFERVMSQENLLKIFGPDATANRRLPFHTHFNIQTRMALSAPAAASNPYLFQMLTGKFPETKSVYPWLSMNAPKKMPEFEYTTGSISKNVMAAEPGSLDFIHLSNTLDWLTEEDAKALLDATARALMPGGVAIIRQLNSCLNIRDLNKDNALLWDRKTSTRYLMSDRSFFYRAIHVAVKPQKEGAAYQ